VTANGPVVEVKGLVKTYRKGAIQIRPVDGVDLEVPRGELLCIMGPSGSGKSTLLHLLGGIDRADQGTVRVGGVELTGLSESKLCAFRAASCSFVFQSFNLVPVLTAAENVDLPLRLLSMSRKRRREQVRVALGIVGLLDRADHLPSQLSGGQEQRVAIARAIATDPQVILADEPTGNLDEESSKHVIRILKALSQDHQKTIVLVTHDPDMAAEADRILYFHHGRLEADAPRAAVGAGA